MFKSSQAAAGSFPKELFMKNSTASKRLGSLLKNIKHIFQKREIFTSQSLWGSERVFSLPQGLEGGQKEKETKARILSDLEEHHHCSSEEGFPFGIELQIRPVHWLTKNILMFISPKGINAAN